MIYPIFFAGIAIFSQQSLSEISYEEAKKIAIQFREIAARDKNGKLLCEPLPETKFEDYNIPERPDEYGFTYSDGIISISKAGGKVVYFSANRTPTRVSIPDWQKSRQLSSDQLLEISRYYWKQAGYLDSLKTYFIERWWADSVTHNMFFLRALRTDSGITMDPNSNTEFGLEYVTGRLYFLSVKISPLAPLERAPKISLKDAFVKSLVFLSEKYSQSYFIEIFPILLCSWAPRSNELSSRMNYLTENDHIQGVKNQGVLIWQSTLSMPVLPIHGELSRMVWVNLKATDGRILGGALGIYYPIFYLTVSKYLWLNLEPGEIRVSTEDSNSTLARASIEQCSVSFVSAKGELVILRRNKVIFVLTYDSKTGLLWARDGKVWKGAKPSANLKKAIEKLTK